MPTDAKSLQPPAAAPQEGDKRICPECADAHPQTFYKGRWTHSDNVPEPLQPAAAPQDETLALVNQALTKAGSRHIVGTKDGAIVACTIEEALQPAAAAPPIDWIEKVARDIHEINPDYLGFEGEVCRIIRGVIIEGYERELARLRALQGTEQP